MPNGFSHHVLHKTLTGFGLWCCLFLIPTAVQSATTNSATLQWAANSESDLAGYKMYQGTTSGSYGLSADVGKVTTYTASNLQTGLTYYFSLTAYDTSGNESLPSIEVSIVAYFRELPRGNQAAAVAKLAGIREGLKMEVPPPPGPPGKEGSGPVAVERARDPLTDR